MGNLIGPDNLKFAPNLETIICVALCLVLSVLMIIVGAIARHADPTKRPKGLLLVADFAVEKLDGFVSENMGEGFENFGGILIGIILFLFSNFIIGLTGLPTPMAYLPVPLSLGLVTFLLIHFTSIRFTKMKYFKRYVEPFPFFLPINLLSMWAPLLSLTLRLFGNALVGWVLLTLVNWGLGNASAAILGAAQGFGSPGELLFVPIATPLLHAYFDVFSSCIQTLVFVFLTTLLVAQEKPEVDPQEETTLISRKEAN